MLDKYGIIYVLRLITSASRLTTFKPCYIIRKPDLLARDESQQPSRRNRSGFVLSSESSMPRINLSTGLKECTKCGELKPADQYHKDASSFDGLRRHCKTCSSVYRRGYYQRKGDKQREYTRNYHARNREYRNASKRLYNQREAEKMREYGRRYHAQNREQRRAISRKYYAAHSEEMKAYSVEYLRNHPESRNIQHHRRRARKQSALNDGTITRQSVLALLSSWSGICPRCGKDAKPTIDHVIPLAKGGAESISNLQLLCRSCNSAKGTKID